MKLQGTSGWAKVSLKEDIRMISGVPAWIMFFLDKLRELAPHSGGAISRIYEKVEMVVHGGVNFSPYVDRFKGILGDSRAELREVYPASEGFIAVADRGYGEGLRMNLDHGMFFEFVPLDELSDSSPTRHWIGKSEHDINYPVVMTTCAGLWSYVIGDTVRFVDTETPRVLVTGRTSYYLSAFGGHLIAEEIEDGITTATRGVDEEVPDFTVGPVFPQQAGELGGHVYVVEFSNGVPSTDKLERFVNLIDTRLYQRNEDYEAHRSGGVGLRAPTILSAKPGLFAAWMKSRGKLGGQNKVPRIITKMELLENL
jgi:hypothetical protein